MERPIFPEQPIAKKREIRGLYLTSLGHGPMASVIIIFIQLIIVKQTKYLAAESSEGENWIEWRESYIDGALCNGTGVPNPKDSQNAYSRPTGYSSNCVWFPSDKTVPGLGIQYTNTIVYGTADSDVFAVDLFRRSRSLRFRTVFHRHWFSCILLWFEITFSCLSAITH